MVQTKIIELEHWREFTNLRQKLSTGEYIFRGHSNDLNYNTGSTNEWKIQSAYKRYLIDTSLSFEYFIQFYLNERLFKMHFRPNRFTQIKNIVTNQFL
jgi:hypothetical protein